MLEPTDAMILLVPVLPIAIWAALSDLKRMKIPNNAVIAMAAVWPLLGWYLVPLTAWFWGFALMVIVFAAGFLLYLTGTFGAGDAKFAAAMAGIFVGGNIGEILLIIFVSMVGSLILHRVLRSLPVVRNATPDWESWTRRRYFPFGMALSVIVVFYLLAAIWPQG
ncbi:prepilin peptidase [Tabrizicola sp.]|jgi:prepilin peptidase CpaA|uniref:A24 family peptidase n=1 Tax=Tabrizicola sp. TaxID=2005166 RepID=UPI001A3724A1|nr:prepilin peptidase [Tabrizicola sp.]MBL9063595.1 prepilin peptidase [Tabrizicola sp.]